ncbi:MAG TPA: galactosyltransferase-related protein [Microbacteriaceae bacterium]|nr:galactosyltransferase-related protein [Microbacteriaceae bacterium]
MSHVLTAVVPFRADSDGFRSRNAEIVVEWLRSAGVAVVVAEEAAQPDASLTLPADVNRISIESAAAFCKARACNAGVLAARSPVVAIVDADTFVSSRVLLECARRVHEQDEVIRPFGSLIELDATQSARARDDGLPTFGRANAHSDARGTEHIPATGGIFLIRRERYLSVGGMDERFVGWGGEDDAFAMALRKSGAQLASVTGVQAGHLWHPRSEASRYAHPHYAANRALALWWATASDADIAERIEVQAEQLRPQAASS